MKLSFDPEGWNDYVFWQQEDRVMLKRVNRLIQEILRDARRGIGKPELLRFELGEVWSRRITSEHRMVYSITDELLVIWQCRQHY
ncbi:hypothetical protein B7R21_00625 [Subtercola boreus]|uniref:Endoribonuclease YoeB n=1 Tax=Subtercola boreus TaxID=120213 RepID=A0A3E0W7V0_9MICO|nr:Txe/YoeB family addiction module toxin [Subtercola boreus]RFA17277.1 hypothetical protein B7R21_00625 [Subtercola boreus]